jgi:hypothetical protein
LSQPQALGDGFIRVPVNQLRGALVRPFWNGHLDAGLNFPIAEGRVLENHRYAGGLETVRQRCAAVLERVVGARIRSSAYH